MIKYSLTWTEFKNLCIISKQLSYQYIEAFHGYKIFASEGGILWECTIVKEDPRNADQIDFEDNYKDNANQTIQSEVVVTNTVNTQVQGGNLDVNIVSGTATAEFVRYLPRFYLSSDDIPLSKTEETELVNLTFDGQLDYILINFSRDDVELFIYVDGSLIFNEVLQKLDDIYMCKQITHTIHVSNNGKRVVFQWNTTPPDVTQSLRITAKKTVSATTKMKSIIIGYRTKVE